jgi:hypothetical protein
MSAVWDELNLLDAATRSHGLRRIERALGERDVTGGCDEARELRVGHRVEDVFFASGFQV